MDETWLTVGDSFEFSEFIGGMVTVGVPFDAPVEFKRRVYAAAQSYVSGNKSVDYFLKRYGADKEFPRPSPSERSLCNFLRGVKYEAHSVYRELTSEVERVSRLGLFAAEVCLARTLTTIRMSCFMLLHGYLYEAAALMRVVLEQTAWAWSVHERDDDAIFSVSPTKSISALKAIISDAGKKYSLLSDYTHINPALQVEYLDFSGECPALLHSQHERSAQMAVMLGRLVDDYRVTAERISIDCIARPVAWKRSEGTWIVNEERPFPRLVDAYLKRVTERAEQGASGDALDSASLRPGRT
jgi:hypothetical protein